MEPLLSDDMVHLRALEPADAERLYLWENDTRMWNVGCATAPFSRKQLEEYIATYDADIYSARQLRLMVVENESGCAVGTADLYDFDPVNQRAGVGILISEEYRGRRYGERAVRLLERYGFMRLGLHQLWAVVPESNSPCRNLFEQAEYRITGRLRSWLRRGKSYEDAYLYQRLNIDANRDI
ncbi:MAG: GNAT family N-acetyltransferase [Paramuribaculum sp.]|nr:GNAT family N-acetyltransferase [Paramuribaculum sp.]MDE7451979.1 GNAT family N-acetyltransferase [Paramuribaculum sp.]